MKSKFLKVAVVALSALAFVNCGDDSNPATPDTAISSASAELPGEPAVESSADAQTPASSADVQAPASSADAQGPASSAETQTPASSADAQTPASSATVPAASSSSVAPAASSSSVAPVASSSSVAPEAPKGIFLSNDTDENKNYMEVVYQTNTGDNGGGVLAYPKNLSTTQKHGVVLWGPGGGTAPTAYEGIIRRLASHGFVVIATSESPSGTDRGIPALNWLAKKNETQGDPLYQKLDMTKVGASGHSMGGLQSEEMLINDSRVITAVMNNSGNLGGGAAQYVPTSKSIALVYGESGSEAPNAERDYDTNVKAPACLIKMEGNNFGHGSGPWDGMALTVSWMRWQLGGEDFRKADFVGTSGKYINGNVPGTPGHYNGKCKNF